MKVFSYVIALATVWMVGAGARADEWNKETIFTVNTAFVVPGAQYTHHRTSVPAGTYILRFRDNQGVQVVAYLYDQTEQHLIATATPIRTSYGSGYFIDAAYDQLVQFEPGETPDAPARLVKWFYPGYDQGWEFVGR